MSSAHGLFRGCHLLCSLQLATQRAFMKAAPGLHDRVVLDAVLQNRHSSSIVGRADLSCATCGVVLALFFGPQRPDLPMSSPRLNVCENSASSLRSSTWHAINRQPLLVRFQTASTVRTFGRRLAQLSTESLSRIAQRRLDRNLTALPTRCAADAA